MYVEFIHTWIFSETKYLKYQRNIEEIAVLEWKMHKFSKLARSHIYMYIHFLNVSALSVYCRL